MHYVQLYTTECTTLLHAVHHYCMLYNTTACCTTLPHAVQHYSILYNTALQSAMICGALLCIQTVELPAAHTVFYGLLVFFKKQYSE